jgi:glycosyltransferase involved in cell wall biosynthesis
VYLKYPETVHGKILSVQKRRLAWVKKEVDLIIADSHATKQDLVDLLSIPQKKIHVIYPAVEIPLPLPSFNFHLPSSNKFILSVGKIEPRKNIPRLIEAFIKADLKNVDLLIIGPEGWETENLEIRNLKLEIPKNIKFLGFVPDSELYSLYKNALFFIYPSLYEGFGYPVIEAMSLGCPVATSNTSSLKEIAEGSAELFDPTSVEEIKKAIVKLTSDDKLRNELDQKGKRRASDFSAPSFFKDFIKTLQKV